MTDEERRVLDHAIAVVRESAAGLLESKPQLVDCIEMRCHPDDEEAIRAMFDAPIVVDATVKPGCLQVVPHAYAKHINVTVGFVNPSDDKAGG